VCVPGIPYGVKVVSVFSAVEVKVLMRSLWVEAPPRGDTLLELNADHVGPRGVVDRKPFLSFRRSAT
jgi:hypothetical protein